MNIIAVDDERPALQAVERAVTSVVDSVTCFTTARQALDYAKTNAVDVAFLDLEMPGMGGIALAEALQAIHKDVNIIFVTGHQRYAVDAFRLKASGYLLKPINERQVSEELSYLRNPVRQLRVQCFGNFQLYVCGKPLVFGRPKSKEILAYLVDRRGASVSKKELAAILWPDEPYTHTMQSHLYVLLSEMARTLQDAAAAELIIMERGSYSVDTDTFQCDYYDYLDNNPNVGSNALNEYLVEYSWAEYIHTL